jgi:hypothetical protein
MVVQPTFDPPKGRTSLEFRFFVLAKVKINEIISIVAWIRCVLGGTVKKQGVWSLSCPVLVPHLVASWGDVDLDDLIVDLFWVI